MHASIALRSAQARKSRAPLLLDLLDWRRRVAPPLREGRRARRRLSTSPSGRSIARGTRLGRSAAGSRAPRSVRGRRLLRAKRRRSRSRCTGARAETAPLPGDERRRAPHPGDRLGLPPARRCVRRDGARRDRAERVERAGEALARRGGAVGHEEAPVDPVVHERILGRAHDHDSNGQVARRDIDRRARRPLHRAQNRPSASGGRRRKRCAARRRIARDRLRAS